MPVRRLINESRSFYCTGMDRPLDIKSMVGRPGETGGRLIIVDLQGISDSARQIIVALLSTEILNASFDKSDRIRPVFLVFEEGHNFAPAGSASLSKNIIKRIASEGRKFGVGFAIVSQRPSKLDPDVTSQCNTLIVMRLKNPDDQNFIVKASDMLSRHDIDVLWLLHQYEEAARVARDVLEIMPDSEMCLRRLVEYETLSGNSRRAEFYRNRLLLLDVPGDQGKSS